MYARSTTVLADPQRLDDGIAFVRDQVMPAVQQMDGFVGLSVLADRASGRCITTAAWADADALKASADRVTTLRKRAAEVFGGRPEVVEWEIAVMHRARPSGEGAGTRVTWGRMAPAGMDRMVDQFAMGVVPRLDEIPGFCSTSLLVDRGSGRLAIAATYESREALAASRDRGGALRQEFMGAVGGSVTEVAEFDLAYAHLRVPETV